MVAYSKTSTQLKARWMNSHFTRYCTSNIGRLFYSRMVFKSFTVMIKHKMVFLDFCDLLTKDKWQTDWLRIFLRYVTFL